jgi:hypothetical protein
MFLTGSFCQFRILNGWLSVKAFCDGFSANRYAVKVLGFATTIIDIPVDKLQPTLLPAAIIPTTTIALSIGIYEVPDADDSWKQDEVL